MSHWAVTLLSVILIFTAVAENLSAAPLRIDGELSVTSLVRYTGEDQVREQDNHYRYRFNANGYIWQPWFAMVNGYYGEAVKDVRSDSSESSRDSDSDEEFYGLNLSVFPSSRFPFRAYTSKASNDIIRETSKLINDNKISGINQSYATPDGKISVNVNTETRDGTFSISEDNNASFIPVNRKTQNDRVNFKQRWSDNQLSVYARSEKEDNSLGEGIDDALLEFRHDYRPSQAFTLDNTVSYIKEKTNSSQFDREVSSGQFSSFSTWRPDKYDDLLITNSLRYVKGKINQNDEGFNSILDSERIFDETRINKSYGGGLTYQKNKNLRYFGSVTLQQDKVNDELVIDEFSQNLGLDYQSDYAAFGSFDRSWNAGMRLLNRQLIDEDERSASADLGHIFNRDFSGFGFNNAFSFSQDVSTTGGVEIDDLHRLSHSIAMQIAPENNNNNVMHDIRFNDSRTYGFERDSFKQINYQWSRNLYGDYTEGSNINMTLQYTDEKDEVRLRDREVSGFDQVNVSESNRYIEELWNVDMSIYNNSTRRSGWQGNLRYQWQRLRTDIDKQREISINGSMRYFYNRFLNVPFLNFSSELDITEELVNDRLQSPDSEFRWRNELIYRLGLLEAQLIMQVAGNETSHDKVVLITIIRRFPIL